MNTENMTVETVETTETRITTRRRVVSDGLTLTANVTEINGKVANINDINIAAENERTIWMGHANPNISGSFYDSGREVEVMHLVTDFIAIVRDTTND